MEPWSRVAGVLGNVVLFRYLRNIPVLSSSSQLSDISACGRTTVYCSLHRRMDAWVASSLGSNALASVHGGLFLWLCVSTSAAPEEFFPARGATGLRLPLQKHVFSLHVTLNAAS